MADTADTSSLQAMKQERDRFLKLAFCRADLLVELDSAFSIVFIAGATALLTATSSDKLVGTSFLRLVNEEHRANVMKLLTEVSREGRIEDTVLKLSGINGASILGTIGGYQTPEFKNHFFLALKLGLVKEKYASEGVAVEVKESGLMGQASFSQMSAQRLQDDKGGRQVTMLSIRSIKDLIKKMGISDRHGLMTTIGNILKSHSIGGATAGQLNDENFSYVHDKNINPDDVNMEIEAAAQEFLPAGAHINAVSKTLDADGAAMSEEQVAKALAFTLEQFCSDKGRVSSESITDSLDEMMNGTVESVKYIKELSKTQQFDIAFMPICDLRLGKVHHFEALSRFHDTERAKSTFQIITLAENLGLIIGFDEAVVDKTIKLIDKLHQEEPIPSVAINLSSLSLMNEAFVDRLHKRLDKDEGLKHRIMFELTESAGVEELDKMNAILQSFRQKGFKFSLDDFGAGAASFDYLNALEVDIVKFDGPVVRRACGNKRGNDLLSTMAKMCTTAGVQTIAEMVEDKHVANQVYYCGIDYGQGWYFGKPNLDPFVFASNFVGKD